MTTRILEPGEIGQVDPFPAFVLPRESDLFAQRSRRFVHLAQGHPMATFLSAMAELTLAQQTAFGARHAGPIALTLLEQSRLHGMPPLSYQPTLRDAEWQVDLAAIMTALAAQPTASWQDAVVALRAMSAHQCDALAEAVLLGADSALPLHALLVPLVGAALQVWWSRQAGALQDADIGHVGSATVCPICASRPVASVVEISANQASLRYLHCALCSTQWHMVRVTCSSCESTGGIAYFSLNGAQQDTAPSRKIAFARAETCDGCHSYLKIFTREKDPLMEANADDLATLALDLLVDQAGYLRSGPNLLFHPGVIAEAPAT